MTQLELFSWRPRKKRRAKPQGAQEWKIVSMRETEGDACPDCSEPSEAVKYWRRHIATASLFNPDVECFAVLLLNTKRCVRGHHLVSIGSLNETMAHPREVFRAAVIGAAYGVVLMHNHPSGDPAPSDADVRMTKRFVESGRILCIEVIDHIIVGHPRHSSFREMGRLCPVAKPKSLVQHPLALRRRGGRHRALRELHRRADHRRRGVGFLSGGNDRLSRGAGQLSWSGG